MKDVQTIRDGADIIAIVIPRDCPAEGARFITPLSYPFQVGVLTHPAGTTLKAHGHTKLRIETEIFQELLVIQKGSVDVDLYGLQHQFVCSVTLEAGDAILFVDGGHGVRIGTAARILEVKQGPYPGDANAKILISSPRPNRDTPRNTDDTR